jgi:hypothetical protein
MSRAAETAAVRVETHGRVPQGSADLAAAKIGSLLRVRRTRPPLSWFRWTTIVPGRGQAGRLRAS